MDVKQNMDEYTRNNFFILSDVETLMTENLKHTYVLKHRYGMKAKLSD
jgi:hypothetical protein